MRRGPASPELTLWVGSASVDRAWQEPCSCEDGVTLVCGLGRGLLLPARLCPPEKGWEKSDCRLVVLTQNMGGS